MQRTTLCFQCAVWQTDAKVIISRGENKKGKYASVKRVINIFQRWLFSE